MDREIKIDLRRCAKAVIRKFWIVAISVIVFTTIGIMRTNTVQTPVYIANATVYSMSYGSYQESLEGASVMKTYADIVTSRKVAERASLIIGDDSLTAETIQAMVDVSYETNSPIITISAISISEQLCVKVANAIADAFVIEAKNITGKDSVQLLDSAVNSFLHSDGASSTNVKRLIYAAVGFILPCLFIVLKEILSTKLYSVSDASLHNELEIIGVIPVYEKL